MTELQSEFPDAVVGLSDHTTDNLSCLGAVALGASVLERHFTDHMGRPGPDIVCSMDPAACSDLIAQSRRLKNMRGGSKGAVDEEQATIDFAYASVVTTAKIAKGEELNQDNLWVKRPGNGDFLAEDYESLIGRIAARDIDPDMQVSHDDLL